MDYEPYSNLVCCVVCAPFNMVWKKSDGQQRSPPPQQQVEVYGGAGYQEGGGPQ